MYNNSPKQQTRPFVIVQYPTPNIKKNTPKTPTENPIKKRQHAGYACDKCRERRVGCDREKPTCGRCKGIYKCQYSNRALRLDNNSSRQRYTTIENDVKTMQLDMMRMEESIQYLTTFLAKFLPFDSVQDLAERKGWAVDEKPNGEKSIQTNIKNFEDLSEVLRNAVEIIYMLRGKNIYRQPSVDWTLYNFTTEEHSFGFFESLGRLPTGKITLRNDDGSITNKMMAQSSVDEKFLEVDIRTRLIQQHHKCSFPTLVSPARFENHYRQGQLKPLVLSSIFSHSVPHISIYHPNLAQIQDFRELGVKFYSHSHDLLGVDDEPTSISNIHQRTFLITYDLDHGRVRRAYLHLGIAIRMCFMLNLHRKEGYVACNSPFEVEQSKRIFWTIWFYDNMVPQLFLDKSSTMKLDQISIDLPNILPEFNQLETEQAFFATRLIQVRMLAGEIAEDVRQLSPQNLINKYKSRLHQFYREMPAYARFGVSHQFSTIWQRRDYYCILLDYCQAWITIYRALLPSSTATFVGPLEQEAILYTSQAAVAMIQLFESWFKPIDRFDCFFRPYLYHFMSAKYIFTANSTQVGRSSALISISRAYLALLLKLYQNTPTKRCFDESHVEKGLIDLLCAQRISLKETPNPNAINEALQDDPAADGGWSIFSINSINHTSSVSTSPISQSPPFHFGVFAAS